MDIHVDLKSIAGLFSQAQTENRSFLYEHEVYELIRLSGAETLPRFSLLARDARLNPDILNSLPGGDIVVKIVSPFITHKSDVGGVRITRKDPEKILSATRAMLYEVPAAFARMLETNPALTPEIYRDLRGEDLIAAIARDIQGVLICQYIPDVSHEFGNELIVSLRRTREFGMTITAGLGGTDTELYAESLKKGQAAATASTVMTGGEAFFPLFKRTISYKKLAGLTRGHRRLVTDEQLQECFSAFIALGNHFSPLNPAAGFVIEDLEINPFAFADYLMLPLDGRCRFSKPQPLPVERPIVKIHNLLHPERIALIGVSRKSMNVGRIILRNILANGFDPAGLRIIHPSAEPIEGIATVPSLVELAPKADLLILAVEADTVPDLVRRIIDTDAAETVLLIPGGLGEKKGSAGRSLEIETDIRAARNKPGGGPLFVGGNSLGILSQPGKFDTFFIPDDKLPKHRGDHPRTSAFISQSGAYMITRMSKLNFLDPAYAVSIGNQIDMTAGDMLRFINRIDSIKTVASYMEGFRDLDGLNFARAIREAVRKGKDVIFYKAGRTPEGKTAMSSHTASLASDYMVCEACVRQAGAMVATTFTGFEGLFRLSSALGGKTISGNRLAAVSNAGYESVGIADNILGEDYRLEMAGLTPDTRQRLLQTLRDAHLDTLVDLNNPLDLTPMADETVYEAVIEILLQDPTVDAVIAALVPLTPLLHTLRPAASGMDGGNPARNIIHLAARSDKPLIIVVDSGPLYDPLAEAFQSGGLPVFRSADQAVWVLGKYIQGRLKAREIRNAAPEDPA
ncbi:MAG: acetate--CoA ligase family protein [Thermodesulfobacteriota bacterium]